MLTAVVEAVRRVVDAAKLAAENARLRRAERGIDDATLDIMDRIAAVSRDADADIRKRIKAGGLK